MPGTYTYPGVYVEEMPGGVRSIVGVSTSDTAFVDFFPRGPMNVATRVTSFGELTRLFGGLDPRSEASYALLQYYLNGGQIAWIVRVAGGTPAAARVALRSDYTGEDTLLVRAASEGLWGESLEVGVDYRTRDPLAFPDEFNLVVREVVSAGGRRQVASSEVHRNLSMRTDSPRWAAAVVNEESALVRLANLGAGGVPNATGADVTDPSVIADTRDTNTAFVAVRDSANPASDGAVPDSAALRGEQAQRTGIYALDSIDPYVFNVLCLPAAATLASGMAAVYNEAASFCERKRAILIVDIPENVNTVPEVDTWAPDNAIASSRNAAVYFPRLLVSDPLNNDRPRNVGPSGTIAGVYARTDSTRGVWKAPAGTDASLRGASLAVRLNDQDNGALNPLGVNVLRNFAIFGNVCWGARTMEGADQQASEWKYVPVRRTALYIEESLARGLKWVVFEPNDEPLWSQIRLNVGAFMQDLFRQGAFQGKSPREAYFVKCDSETTTQSDINRGVVNIVVGFAPLKPAEFVVIQIQQMAGQAAA
ncbi:MAG: phage tail sheath family protein [Chthonomonadales bacterium]|nr:phage tail sheath family protein [Chthonomonadales bacterium]